MLQAEVAVMRAAGGGQSEEEDVLLMDDAKGHKTSMRPGDPHSRRADSSAPSTRQSERMQVEAAE